MVYLYLYLYVTWQYALFCYRVTGGFIGVSLDENCAYVHWGFFTSNYSSVRRIIWFTWFSKPQTWHHCTHVIVYTAPGVLPGGHPSNYVPGPALLNFSDRANTDELTPYSAGLYMVYVVEKLLWQVLVYLYNLNC